MALARVVDREVGPAEGGQDGLQLWDDGTRGGDVVALMGEVAAFGADWVCRKWCQLCGLTMVERQ